MTDSLERSQEAVERPAVGAAKAYEPRMPVCAFDRRSLPFIVAVGLVVAISLAAYTGHVPPAIAAHGVDKILHAAMGAALTCCLAVALRGRSLLAGALVFAPLALDEYLQRFSASRSSDWGDLLADALGIGVAIAALHLRRSVVRSHR